MRRTLDLIAAGLHAVPAASARDVAAINPNCPIRIMVCVLASGGVDIVTCISAEGLHHRLGQPVGSKIVPAPRAISAPSWSLLPIRIATPCLPNFVAA